MLNKYLKNIIKSSILLGIITLVFTPEAFAVSSGTGFSAKDLFQPLFSLVIVIFMIYTAFYAYSKLNKYNIQKFSKLSKKNFELSRLSLISHLSLGQNKSVDVIEINGKYLVLGVTGENISLIKEFDGAEQEDINKLAESFAIQEPAEQKNIQEKTGNSLKIDELYKKYYKRKSE